MRPGTVDPFGLFQESLEVYRKQFAVLFPLSLIVGLIQAMLLLGFGSDDPAKIGTGELIATMIALLPTVVFLAFTVELLRDVRSGRDVRPTGELISSVLPILLPLVAITVIVGVATAIGLVLLVVPGLFLVTIWSVVLPVYVVERPTVSDSFGRSRALVRGYGWSVFATILLVVLISLLGAIIGALLAIDPTSAIGSFVQLAVTSLVTPITTLMLAALYFRLVGLHGPAAVEPGRDPAHDAFGARD